MVGRKEEIGSPSFALILKMEFYSFPFILRGRTRLKSAAYLLRWLNEVPPNPKRSLTAEQS